MYIECTRTSERPQKKSILPAVFCVVLAFMFILVTFIVPSGAVNYVTWDAPADGNWSTATNWSTDTVPGSLDTVVFNNTSQRKSYIDLAFGGTVEGITILYGYWGTITQQTGLHITGDFIHQGGDSSHFYSDVSKNFVIDGSFKIPEIKNPENRAFTRFDGDGYTAATAYGIYDVYGLQAMMCAKATTYFFELKADIDASPTRHWNWNGATWEGFYPVGTAAGGDSDYNFRGDIDGKGHTVAGLYISREATDFVGLFGYADGGSIKNIGLVGVDITGHNDVGSLIGENGHWYGSEISSCYANGNVIGTNSVGGLIGFNYIGNIKNCHAIVSVKGGNENIGGLVGHYNNSSSQRQMTNCYATGNVNGKWEVGGLVGDCYNGIITNCYASGNVNGVTSNLGGLVGNFYGSSKIINSYATGNVANTGIGDRIGGLVGRMTNLSEIWNSYAKGNVNGWINSYIGGLVGEMTDGKIYNSYATGNAVGSAPRVGGLLGGVWNTYTVSGCHYSGTPNNFFYGTYETAAAIKNKNTFTGWDFKNLWMIDEDKNTPYLTYEAWNLKTGGNWTTPTDWTKNLITQESSYPQTLNDYVFVGTGESLTVPIGVTQLGSIHMGTGATAVTLQSDISLWTLAVHGGAFDTASKNISLAGNFSHSGGTFTQGTGTVDFITGALHSLVEGNTTFNNFTCTVPGKQLSFEAGSRQTIGGLFTITGSSGNRISLRSMTDNMTWEVNPVTMSNTSVNFADVKDSTNINSDSILAYNSVDRGRNVRWLFLAGAPSGCTITPLSTTSVRVDWIDNSSDEILFRIEESTDNGATYTSVGTVPANTTSYTGDGTTGFSTNSRCYFRVRAEMLTQVSDYSTAPPKYTLAAPPFAASFEGSTFNEITAKWSAGVNPAGTKYYCENITTGGNSGTVDAFTWLNSGLSSGSEYSYRVRAYNGDGIPTDWTVLGLYATKAAKEIYYFASEGVKLLSGDVLGHMANISVVVSSDAALDISSFRLYKDGALVTDGTDTSGYYDSYSVNSIFTTFNYKIRPALAKGVHAINASATDTLGSIYTGERTNLNVWADSIKRVEGVVLPYPDSYDPLIGNIKITFRLATDTDTTVYVFDVNGRLSWKQFYPAGSNGGKAGYNEVLWNGIDMSNRMVDNDVYLIRIVETKTGNLMGKGKFMVFKSK